MELGVDYYINNNGLYVFTAKYLLERGYCCKNNCLHCPFDYKKQNITPLQPTEEKSPVKR